MDEDCIKLTSYFSERHRTAGRLTGDALVELYQRSDITASVALRGIEGFEQRHYLRTDRSLSRSEDLPFTVTAVDRRSRIEAVVDETARLNATGLITLERARLLSGDIDPVGLLDEPGEATKLTIYLNRSDCVYQVPAYEVICELLHRRGIDGATVLLGVDGTSQGQRRRAQLFSHNADLPVMLVAVGSGGRIGTVLPELDGLLRHPLITLESVRVCKRDGQLINQPEATPDLAEDGTMNWQKLSVYTSEAARYDGQPIHRAIIRRLKATRVSGATAHRGIWGFHGEQPPHGDRRLQFARHVPVITTLIDSPSRIAAALSAIDELTSEKGLITSETITARTIAAQ